MWHLISAAAVLRRTLATILAARIPGQVSEVVVVGSGNIRAALARLGLPVSVHAWVGVAVAQEDAGVRADRHAEGALLAQEDLQVALRIHVAVRELGHLGRHLPAEQLGVDALQLVHEPALVIGRRVPLVRVRV